MLTIYKNRLRAIGTLAVIFVTLGIFCGTAYAQGQWKWQNPLPQGNDLAAIDYVNASVGTAVGFGGVILRTTDGGNTWAIQNSGINSSLRSVSTVDVNTAYAVGDYGVILKTTDAGATWDTLSSGIGSTFLRGVTFIDANTGWAVGDSHTIIKTTDGGNTWISQSSGSTALYSVSFINANNGIVVGASGTINLTTDGGTSWAILNSGITTELDGVSLIDTSTATAVGVSGVIIRTTDGGATWVNDSSGTTNKLWSVSFTSVNNGIAAGAAGTIVNTTDGGTTWTLQNSGITSDLYTVSFLNSNTGSAVGTYGVILKTTDGGGTWFSQSTQATTNVLRKVCFIDTTTGWAVGGVTGSSVIVKTTNGGSTWDTLSSGTTQNFYGVDFVDANTGYTVGTGGTLLKTTDGGNTWVSQTSGLTTTLIDVYFTDANTGTAVGASGKIVRTTDGGNTWVAQTSGITQGLTSVFFVNTDTGYVTASSRAYSLETTNGGATWSSMTGLPKRNWLQILFVNPDTGWTCGAYVYETTDGGTTWNSVTVPIAATWEGMSFSDANHGILAGSNGTIISTTDGGQTWNLDGYGISYNYFYGVSFPSANAAWVVGANGDILRKNMAPPPTTFQLSVAVENGWNMVSVPGINPDGMGVSNWWASHVGNVYRFAPDTGYVTVTTTTPTIGYWMKNDSAETYNTGDEWPAGGIEFVPYNPITVAAGWNMLGVYDYNVAVSGISPAPVGSVYGFTDTSGYFAVTTLIPGYSYWAKFASAGQITLPPPGFEGSSKIASIEKTWGKIIITGKAGRNYTLYAENSNINLNNYDLPPLPPSGLFDVRYGSGRYVENLSSGTQTIDMQGIQYPVTVKAEGVDITLQDASGKIVNTELTSGQEITISDNTINKLMILTGDVTATEPITYSLEQNYPNPFNPSTTIKFSIPKETNVSLTIYNILGQRVDELVNSRLSAGNYSYHWDASKYATGIYIYKLSTNNFVSVKKMMLIK